MNPRGDMWQYGEPGEDELYEHFEGQSYLQLYWLIVGVVIGLALLVVFRWDYK